MEFQRIDNANGVALGAHELQSLVKLFAILRKIKQRIDSAEFE